MRRFEHRCPLSRPFIRKFEVIIWRRCLTRWGKCASPAYFEPLRHYLANLHQHARQLILTPARDLPRPLEVGRDLISQGRDFFWFECTGFDRTASASYSRLGDADLELWDFVEVVLFGAEVEAGHGRCS